MDTEQANELRKLAEAHQLPPLTTPPTKELVDFLGASERPNCSVCGGRGWYWKKWTAPNRPSFWNGDEYKVRCDCREGQKLDLAATADLLR